MLQVRTLDRVKEKKSGFTLVELLVVVVIMAILAAILIPSFAGYADKAGGTDSVAKARLAYTASSLGLMEWKVVGSPGNGDSAYKINIEHEIISLLDLGEMKSFTETGGKENVVQVALSLPSYFSQGWAQFLKDCESNSYRNFVRVWIGKNPDRTIKDTVQAIYYISADGKYVSRIVYDETTKLGSVDQRTGTYFERLD